MRGLRLKIRTAVLWIPVLAAFAVGAEYTITTADGGGADTYLNYYGQNTNYGLQTALKISKNYVPYLKFDLSGIALETVTSATLSLYGPPDPNELPEPYIPLFNTTFVIYGLIDGSDGWSETGITYTNAPLVSNPIMPHIYLMKLGTIAYTVGDPGVISMTPEGNNFIEFLNDRGPDGLVTILIASANYSTGYFFSTQEMYGDGSEAPFLELSTAAEAVPYNNWTGSSSNDWNTASNWTNEQAGPDLPDPNDITVLVSGSNYPVVIDTDAFARELYLHGDGIDLLGQTLYLSSGVLRIRDGERIYMNDSQIIMEGNYALLLDAYFGDGKIQCMPGKEINPVWIDPNLPGDPGYTQATIRKALPQLQWQAQILSASGPTGTDGYSAQYCVDTSGLSGSMHAPYAAYNSYYGRLLGPAAEPIVEIQFDKAYPLAEMWVWNYEDTYNGYGFRKVEIEYSTDGIHYSNLLVNSEPNFILAQGNSDGSKSDVIDFGGVPAQYVRIKALGGAGVGNHEWRSSLGNYILKELRFYYDEPRARNPYPPDQSGVNIDVDLSWIPGTGAVTGQDVWFGKTEATMTKIGDNIADDAYTLDLPVLEDDENYVWRVDGLDSGGSTTLGQLWTFRTKAWLHWNPGGEGVIYADGPSGISGSAAANAANETGITGNLHASFLYSNGWYCRKPWDLVPPITEPELFIEFDKVYEVNEIWVWNHEGTSGIEAPIAMKTVKLEYSIDNIHYTTLMNGSEPNFILPHGNTDGTHDTVLPGGFPARYIKFTAVGGPGVGNYGSTEYGYKLRELRFYHDGAWINPRAHTPTPPDTSETDIFVELGWTPGSGTVTGQDVWFAKVGQPLVKIGDNLDPAATSLELDRLDNFEEYHWRVDGLNSGGSTTTGDEWTFSTRARLRPNPGGIGIIAADGSAGNGGTPGYLAVDESGITIDLHAPFQWSNGWYCRKPWELVPPLTEPVLLVQFDRPYAITDMWVWNHDGVSTDEAAMAMKTVQVEYSTDGVNFSTVMNGASQTFILPHGNTDGTHDTVISFGGAEAQYVRFTAVGGPGVGNYGSTTWGYKLRELRFYYIVPLWADLDYDGDVDIADLGILALHWLENNWVSEEPAHCSSKPIGDINGDCFVDFGDFEEMSKEWLAGTP